MKTVEIAKFRKNNPQTEKSPVTEKTHNLHFLRSLNQRFQAC